MMNLVTGMARQKKKEKAFLGGEGEAYLSQEVEMVKSEVSRQVSCFCSQNGFAKADTPITSPALDLLTNMELNPE